MRQILILSFLLTAALSPPAMYAAACPNLSVHPGITTLFVQTDFGEKDTATKIFATGLEDAIKKSRQFCLVQDLRAANFALDLTGVDITDDHERAAVHRKPLRAFGQPYRGAERVRRHRLHANHNRPPRGLRSL